MYPEGRWLHWWYHQKRGLGGKAVLGDCARTSSGALLRVYTCRLAVQQVVQIIEGSARLLSRKGIIGRLQREGWYLARHGADHDIYEQIDFVPLISVPRHNNVSPVVARTIPRPPVGIKRNIGHGTQANKIPRSDGRRNRRLRYSLPRPPWLRSYGTYN